ncbi:MATE family efflux transporter [Fusibacter ferrireducens]|uniref:MATE family efflux transporter n=1 Tax=Fusibacter ferrireducens TaxID=2785058 RepID=A0ABR9ZXK3_9FIRM|nr:MATE family efflux transporter [Fusibacter ferrireducens]MBF4695199.1 MATE family efflux transporter [Fusibacter ferrireducens]
MDYSEKRALILEGQMKKVIWVLSVPVMINNFIQTIYNLTDTFFVGRIGGNEVAAIQLVWPINFMVMAFGIGMSIAASALISQYIGADRHEKARLVSGQVVSLLLVMGVMLSLIGYGLSGYIVKWMGATGSLYDNASSYLSIIFLGMPALFLLQAFNGIKQGQGDTISPMVVGASAVVLNMILDPIFIFKFQMGISGAAIATVIAQTIFALYAVSTLFIKDKGIKITIKELKWDMKIINKIISVGLPSSIGQATTAFGFAILNVFLISFGEVTLTAFAIGNRINSLIMMPAMGIGSALATVVGQNLGADNKKRAKEAVRTSAALATIILVTSGLIMWPFAQKIVEAFAIQEAIIQSSTEYLRILIMAVPLMGVFQVLIGTFQGSGHTISAMILMMGRLWGIRIPMVFALSHWSGFNPSSVWYAMYTSNLIICLIGYGIYLTGNWQNQIIKNKPQVSVDL